MHARYGDGDDVHHAAAGARLVDDHARQRARRRLWQDGRRAGRQGGKSTYVAVEDTDAVYARAKAAGATILEEPVDRDYGSRDFICADPEGNVWSFGTYWPKAGDPTRLRISPRTPGRRPIVDFWPSGPPRQR